MKYKKASREMLKTTDTYLSAGLLAAYNLAGWLGYEDEGGINLSVFLALAFRYNEVDKLIDAKKELEKAKESIETMPTTEKDEENDSEEYKEFIALKKKEIAALESESVAITSSIAYTTLKQCALEGILNYSMENSKSYMGMVAAPFALAFFCAFMEKMFIDRYQYKASDDLKDRGTYENNALILYYSFLQATTLASCNLAAHILMKHYGENISGCIKTVVPIPGVRDFIAAIITTPRVCGEIFEALATKALGRSAYTHEVDMDLPQMVR